LTLNRGGNTIALETKAKVAIGLALAFIVLNVADILLTWQCLRLGAVELNFFMNSVLALGFFPSILFRLGIASGLAAIMLYRGQISWLIIAVSMFSFVCALNMLTIVNLS
jgi:hypothetical protein